MIARTNAHLWQAALALPKTDLHCHLDGSLRPETVMDIAQEESIDLGADSIETLKEKLVCGQKVQSLPQFLNAFGVTCSVLQSAKAIERAAFELAEDAAKENVWHLEVRFAPQFLNQKISKEDVIRSVAKGLDRAKEQYGISTGIIICAIRINEPQEHIELAKLAASLQNIGVVGFDLAHAENGNPAKDHAEAFSMAKELGLHRTVHAGEDYGPASIQQAIEDCHAQRIGHGRTLGQDLELEQNTIDQNIVIECCPSSNVQISLTPEFSQHPLKGFLNRGVKATLSTDNRLLTGILASDEYYRAAETMECDAKDWITLARNGFEGAFVSSDQKQKLLDRFDSAIEPWRQAHHKVFS